MFIGYNHMTLSSILSRYNAFIIDLWGVVHDGTQLYPGAAEALAYLHAQQKPVVFLSNAPRRAAAAEANLERLGIPRTHYLQVITSGEVAYEALSPLRGEGWVRGIFNRHDHAETPPHLTSPPMGERNYCYYYLGPSKDEEIFADAPNLTRVENLADADFVLNTGYAYDFQPHDEILPLLHQLYAQALPLLCVNPDLEVVKQDGTHMLCAGALAAAYEGIGGSVHYIGKPHAPVYNAALNALNHPHPPAGAGPSLSLTEGEGRGEGASHPKGLSTHHILAIGDNPLTDILGANHYGIDSLLIAGGVLSHHHGALTEKAARILCNNDGADPTYVAAGFSLFPLPLGEG
jgi:ribonucleotide monophosphatase NagD (HAD superfamily)